MAKTAQTPYLMTVLTGPNAGAQEPLARGRYTVAGGGNADFILDDLPGSEVEIAIAQDRIRLKTYRDDLRLMGARQLVPGVATFATLPATIELQGGAVQIHICRVAAPKKRKSFVRRFATVSLCLIALGIGAVTVNGPQGRLFGEAMANILKPMEIAPLQVSAEATPPADFGNLPVEQAARPQLTLDDAHAMVLRRAEEATLDGLEITSSDGALRITGFITDRQTGLWQSIRRDYDKQFGQVAPMLLDIEETVEVAPVAISSIWLGKTVEFSTPEGDILRVGDQTETGWTIVEINASSVALERGQQKAVVEF